MAEMTLGIIRLHQTKMLEKLKKARALSPDTAVALEEVEIKRNPIFDMLVKQNKVKRTENGRYYVYCKEKRC